MLLRLLLVGAVTTMGLDLPTGRDLERWCRSGRDWWEAAVARCQDKEAAARAEEAPGESLAPADLLRSIAAEMTPGPSEPVAAMPTAEASVDEAFQAVVGGMVMAFREAAPAREAGAAVISAEEIQGSGDTTPTFEPVEVPEDLYPGLAYALNREAEGVPTALLEEAIEMTEVTETKSDAPRTRLATAIRLTGQAVQAWLSVLHQGPTAAPGVQD
ncbi:MAG: hypothetical protein IRY99_25990 [Isosphaeraceae bacterium]|nr:hypothetical protein [Isosphaeraceae bacterium]